MTILFCFVPSDVGIRGYVLLYYSPWAGYNPPPPPRNVWDLFGMDYLSDAIFKMGAINIYIFGFTFSTITPFLGYIEPARWLSGLSVTVTKRR